MLAAFYSMWGMSPRDVRELTLEDFNEYVDHLKRAAKEAARSK